MFPGSTSRNRLLSVVLLLGNNSLLVEVGVTLQVTLRIFEVCLVFVFRCLGLRHLDFVRPWINQGEFVALPNVLTFPKMNLHQLSINPTMNGDSVVSLNVSQPFEINRNVTLLHR